MLLNVLVILLVASFIWLALLSILFSRLLAHYNKLAQGSPKGLKTVLDELLATSSENKKAIEMLRIYCDKIEKESRFHIQKIGLHRFNPFKDTGGDQSFILSLVDLNDTGVIISG